MESSPRIVRREDLWFALSAVTLGALAGLGWVYVKG